MNEAAPPITINFARVQYGRIVRIKLALFLVAAVLALAAAVLIAQARSLRVEAANAERSLQDVTASLETMKPAIEEREKIVKNLTAMSALIDARKFSWVRLLTGLEDAFPSGVALDGISIEPKTGAVSLEGRAQSPENLSQLMIGLQKTRVFRNPQLKRQSLDKGNLEFHVDVVYQNVPAGVASELAGR